MLILIMMATHGPSSMLSAWMTDWWGFLQIGAFLIAAAGFIAAVHFRHHRSWAGLTALSGFFSYGAIGWSDSMVGGCAFLFMCPPDPSFLLAHNALAIACLATLASSVIFTISVTRRAFRYR